MAQVLLKLVLLKVKYVLHEWVKLEGVHVHGCGRVLEALHTSDSQTSLFTLGMVKADQSKRSLLIYKSHRGGRA